MRSLMPRLAVALAVVALARPVGAAPVHRCGKNLCNGAGARINQPELPSPASRTTQRIGAFTTSPSCPSVAYDVFFPEEAVGILHVFAVNEDGSAHAKVDRASLTERHEDSVLRAMAPDCSRIAYVEGRTSLGDWKLVTVAPSGAASSEVHHAGGFADERKPVTFSCDSKWLLFWAKRDGTLTEWFAPSRPVVPGGITVAAPIAASALPERAWPGSAGCTVFADGFESGTTAAWRREG